MKYFIMIIIIILSIFTGILINIKINQDTNVMGIERYIVKHESNNNRYTMFVLEDFDTKKLYKFLYNKKEPRVFIKEPLLTEKEFDKIIDEYNH